MSKTTPKAKLTIVKRARYGALTLEFYGNIRSIDFYMTRDQIGRALGYDNPKDAISKIHRRHKQRLDTLSRVDKLSTERGKEREVFLYEAKGIYEICRHSDKPNADAFFDFVYEILEGLRLGHFKLIAEKATLEWQQARKLSKEVRKDEADIIKLFVEYARSQGSKNAERYYTLLSNLANNAADIKDRDYTITERLHNLQLVERVIGKALKEGMDIGFDYHDIFKEAKRRVEQFIKLVELKEVS